MKQNSSSATKLLAVILTVLMLITSIPLAAFASETFGEEGDYVVPISNNTTVDVGNVNATTFDELADYLRKTESYTTPVYETYPSLEVGISVYYSTDEDMLTAVRRDKDYHRNNKRDMIIYAINYKGERIGTEDDVSIIKSYIEEGYVVLVADFNNNPLSGTPNIEHAAAEIRAYYNAGTATGLSINGSYVYVLPSGYRLERDVWFWNSFYYSAVGSRVSTLNAWNNYIALGGKSSPAAGHKYTEDVDLTFKVEENGEVVTKTYSYDSGETIEEIEYVEQTTRKNGLPLIWDAHLDIIYPSQPKHATSVYLMAATQPDRHDNTCNRDRCTFVGMAFQGYTVSIFDHVYTPMSRSEAYGYIGAYANAGHSTLRWAQAAVRCVRYYADDFGYDPSKIGVGGISKATPPSGALSIVNNEQSPEYNGRSSAETAVMNQYGVDYAYEGDIIVSDTERITLQQPFLYYDVPYGPVLDKDGKRQHDVYGNVITYDYYGDDGEQYIRTPAKGLICDYVEGDKFECDEDFRVATGKSIAKDYREIIDARKASDTYTSKDGKTTWEIPRAYGTEEMGAMSTRFNQEDTYYYFIDTDVTASYVSAGGGIDRYYSTGATGVADYKRVPMIICCGSFDPYGCFDNWYPIWDSFKAWEDKGGNPYIPNTMVDQGHIYPSGYDYAHGFRRHDMFLQFFNHYLNDAYNYADVVWMTPVNGTSVTKPTNKPQVKFYNRVELASVEAGVIVKDSKGNTVEGTWEVSEVDTLFTFTPTLGLAYGETYTMTAKAGVVKAVDGDALPADVSTTFTVTTVNSYAYPKDDTYTATGTVQGVKLQEIPLQTNSVYQTALKIGTSTKGTVYATFDKADLVGKTALRFEAVFMSDPSGADFDVYMVDNYGIDTSTLSYNAVPAELAGGKKVATVSLDKYGYGSMDLTTLGLSDSGDVTFILRQNGADSVMFESEESIERGAGIVAVGRTEQISPVSDTYVSQSEPDAVYGNATSLILDGSIGKNKYAYISFDAADLVGRSSVELAVPMTVVNGVYEIYAFDGYLVDETKLTWNNKPALSSGKLLGKATANLEGMLLVNVTSLELTGDYVTFAVVPELEAVTYDQDFEGRVASTGTFYDHMYSKDYDYRVGGAPQSTGQKADPTDSTNKVFGLKTSSSGRVKFYSVFAADRDLTEDDIGATYRIDFKLYLSEDYGETKAVQCAVMNEEGWDVYGASDKLVEVPALGAWYDVSYDVVITRDMLTADNPGLFTIDSKGASASWFYIDDMKATRLGSSGSISSSEGANGPVAMVAGAASRVVISPESQIFVDKTNPTALSGNVTALPITKDGNKVSLVTFDAESVKGSANVNLRLPSAGTDGFPIAVYVIDGAADPASYNWNSYAAAEKSFLTNVSSANSTVSIDVAAALSKVSGNKITFALVKADGYTYSNNFTGYTTSYEAGNTVPTIENGVVTAWNSVVIYNADEAASKKVKYRSGWLGGSRVTSATSGDNTYLTISILKGTESERYKFYNFLGDSNFTQDDLGKKYAISFDIWASVENAATYSLMNPYTFTDVNGTKQDGTATASAGLKNGTGVQSITVTKASQTVTDVVTVTQQMIDGQFGMISFTFKQGASAGYTVYVDNFKSTEILSDADELTLNAPMLGGAALVHTHVFEQIPSFEALVDQTNDQSTLFYEACTCGVIGTHTYTHNHTATEVVADRYLKTAATCSAKAVYYKSCEDCGMRLDDTFEYGFAAHTAGETVNGVTYCAVCGQVESATVEARYSSDEGATWTFANLDAAITALTGKSGIIEIIGNMSVSKEYTIPANTTIILRSDTSARENFAMKRASSYKSRFFTISGTLTLENITLDSDASINLATALQGGLIRVMGGGTLTLESGAILENVYNTQGGNTFGGAIYICDGGTVTMNEGAIIRNCATRMGAGVYVGSRLDGDGGNGGKAVFTMNGGLITGNRTGITSGGTFGDTYGSGPAVYVYSSRSFVYLNGGLITGNTAGRKADKWVSDGAIFSNDGNGKITLSGDIVIRDNYAWNADNTAMVESDLAAYRPDYLDATYIFTPDFSGSAGITCAISNTGTAIANGFQIGTVSGGTTGNAISGVIEVGSDRVAVISGTKVVIQPAAAILTSEETDVTAEDYIERRYMSIDAALVDVRNGCTLTLLADGVMTKQYAVPANTSFTIEGNGHTIKRSGNYAMAMIRLGNSGANLTIKVLTMDGDKISLNAKDNAGGLFYVGDGATLTMDGGALKNSYLNIGVSGCNGAAVNVGNGGTFIMIDGTIENCQARGGGAVFLTDTDSTASKYATFIMYDGLITNCRAGSDQAMGSAVYMGGYSKMEMHGGVITGNSGTRYDWGGFGSNILNPDGTKAFMTVNQGKADEKQAEAMIPKDIAADGAIGFRSANARLLISGDAIIRGNTVKSMYQNKGGTETLESDIGFFGYNAACVTFDANFSGSVGINYPCASYVNVATVREGMTIPATTSQYANYYNDVYHDLVRTPVADGAVKIASVSGSVKDGAIMGNIFDNQTGRVAKVSGNGLVLTSDYAATLTNPAAPEYTDAGYTYTRYDDLLDAIANAKDGMMVTLNKDYTITAPFAITESFTLDGEGNTITRSASFKNDAMIRLETSGTELTVKNITFDGANVVMSSDYTGGIAYVGNGATLNMEAGTVMQNTKGGALLGGSVHVLSGGTFNMKGGIIRNNNVRSGGAVYLTEIGSTSSKHAIFNMSGGIITGCRVENFVSMGSAVLIRSYSVMNMSGGLITGNTTLRTHHGGVLQYAFGQGDLVPMDQVCDGAIAIRSEYATRTFLNISGDAVIRGNYAQNKLATGEDDKLVESDIGFFKGLHQNVTIADNFTGSIGIFLPNSTYTVSYELKEGQTTPSAAEGGYFKPEVLDVTYNYVEDGSVKVATLNGSFENGQILGTVIDNTTGNKVGVAQDGILYWTSAEAETDVDGIRTRYVDLDDAIATGETAILLKDASFSLAKAGDKAYIAQNGFTATPEFGAEGLSVKVTTKDETITYTYDGMTFEIPAIAVTEFEAVPAAPVITSVNLAVGVDLTLKFYARLDAENANATLNVVMNAGAENEKTAVLEGTLYDAENGIYVYAFKGITPQCMGDVINAQLMNGETAIGDALTGYSVKMYLGGVLELYSSDAIISTLVSDMLAYGAAAQNYVGYKTDALVTDGFEDVAGYAPSNGAITDDVPMTLTANISDSVKIKNGGLEFSNVNRLKFEVVTDDLSKTTVTLNGEEVTLTAVAGKENTYSVFTDELNARQFDNVFTLVLTYEGEGGTQTQTLTYSVNNYAYRVHNGASFSETAKALAYATYYYGVSANAYTG